MGEKISFIDLFGTELELEDEYAREQLADESAARAEDVAVLEARMDTFTALPAGSTAGDAELMDIRVGADGITYANAGDAMRGQITKLNNNLHRRRTKQLFNKDNYSIFLGYFNLSVTVANSAYKSLILPVDISEQTTFSIHKGSPTSRFAACAISETTVTGGENVLASANATNDTYIINAPANTGALVIYFYNEFAGDTEDVVQPFIDSLMVEVGNTFTGYVPYYEYPNVFKDDLTVKYIETLPIYLGDELRVNGGHYDSPEWSGDNENGYTHTSANETHSISFYVDGVEENEIYLLEFDTTYTDGEFIKVGIGSAYKVLVYNGLSHIVVPLKAIGTQKTLYFTPTNPALTFTISNVSLKKIQKSGTEKELIIYNTETANHNTNYGFWNVLLGKNTMENAVGSTRSIAIGYASLNALEGGHRNVGIGTFAMSQLTGGESNVSIGSDSMLRVQTGDENVTAGFQALCNSKTATKNVAIGLAALAGSSNGSQSYNTAVGAYSGFHNNGSHNTLLGAQTGYRIANGVANTIIGANAYGQENGNNNTIIGYEAGYENGVSNAIAIGQDVIARNNNEARFGRSDQTIILGNKKINFNTDGSVTWEPVDE